MKKNSRVVRASVAGVLVAGLFASIAGVQAPAEAALKTKATQCTDLVVIGVRGSTQSMNSGSIYGFGPEVSNAAKNMTSRIKRSGTYRYGSIPYPAALDLRDPSMSAYKKSVREGAATTKSAINAISKACGSKTKFALIGYSQGAHVIRAAMPQIDTTARSRIVAVGLIADPTRRGFNVNPSETGYFENFDSGVEYGSGLLGAGTPYTSWLSSANNKVASFCVKDDPVCNKPSWYAPSAFSVKTHVNYYQSSKSASLIGLGLYTRLVHGGFR